MSSITGFNVAELFQGAISDVGNILAPLNSFSFGIGNASKSNTVKVPIIGAMPSATAFDESTNNFETSNGGTASTVSVLIDKNKKSTFDLLTNEAEEIGPIAIQAMLAEAIKAVVRGVYVDVYGAVLATAFTNQEVIASTAFDIDSINTIRTKLEDLLGVDQSQMFNMHLNSAYILALGKDSTYKSLFASAGDTSVIKSGAIPTLYNTQIFKSTVPTNSENLAGFICDRSALAVAFKQEVITDTNDYLATDAQTGVSLVLRERTPGKGKRTFWTVESDYGVKAINGKALVRVRSAL